MKKNQTAENLRHLSGVCLKLCERFERLPLPAIQWTAFTNSREKIHAELLSSHRQRVLFRLPAKMLWLVFRSIYWSGLVWFLRLWSRKTLGALKGISFPVIAKTWCVDPKRVAEENDFYLGDLQKRFEGKGVSLLLLGGNVSRKKWFAFARGWNKERPARLADFALLSPFSVFWMVFLQSFTSVKLYAAALFEKDPLTRRVLRQASLDILAGQTLFNGLNYWIGKEGARLWRPKAFLSLYEGHAWEKCLWAGIKKGFPECKIWGYQHTVIMEHALSLRQGHFKPDLTLCSGYTTLEMMKKNNGQNLQSYIPFGSYRFMQKEKKSKTFQPTILVIPEGIEEEARLLFNAALEAALELKTFRFLFRSHPVLPFSQVEKGLSFPIAAFSNVELSEGAIDKDFERASFVLYRGSSAVLYAVLEGLVPFYLNAPESPFIDPLFEITSCRQSVSSGREFAARLKQNQEGPNEALVKYIQNYTLPVLPKVVDQLIATL